jgi:hypothetical protein
MCLVAVERRLRMRDGAKNSASIRRSRRSSPQSNDWHMCRRNRLKANDTYQQIAASEATLAHKGAGAVIDQRIFEQFPLRFKPADSGFKLLSCMDPGYEGTNLLRPANQRLIDVPAVGEWLLRGALPGGPLLAGSRGSRCSP